MSAIARMKVTAGIDICHELAPKHRTMMKKLSLPRSLSYNPNPIMIVFNEWIAGKTSLPSTWEEMMAVIREIGVDHLAESIEMYFIGEQSLPFFKTYSEVRLQKFACVCI